MKQKNIRDLPRTERPRERLAMLGVANLTTTELIALLVGSGSKKRNALRLAEQILDRYEDRLSLVSAPELAEIPGIGWAKASKLLAAIEFGHRLFAKNSSVVKIREPEDVLKEVNKIRQSRREFVVGLYLNARYELLKKQTLTIGGMNRNSIEPRDVFATALTLPCSFIILVHNHPSGSVRPSDNDVKTSQALEQAGKLLGVALLDHLIVSKNGYFSFQEGGLLN